MKEDRFAVFEDKILKRDRLIDFVTNFSISPEEINPTLENLKSSPIRQKIKLIDIISRPQVTIPKIIDAISSLKEFVFDHNLREEIIEAAEVLIKYSGYIAVSYTHLPRNIMIQRKYIRMFCFILPDSV